jgi:hypothetical protein
MQSASITWAQTCRLNNGGVSGEGREIIEPAGINSCRCRL